MEWLMTSKQLVQLIAIFAVLVSMVDYTSGAYFIVSVHMY